jgi:hypothetical protein
MLRVLRTHSVIGSKKNNAEKRVIGQMIGDYFFTFTTLKNIQDPLGVVAPETSANDVSAPLIIILQLCAPVIRVALLSERVADKKNVSC